jgi:hypothetical protein
VTGLASVVLIPGGCVEFRRQTDLFRAVFRTLREDVHATLTITEIQAVNPDHYYRLTYEPTESEAHTLEEVVGQRDLKERVRDSLFQGSRVYLWIDPDSGNYRIARLSRRYL